MRWKSEKYLNWVRSQPCMICGRVPSEAHHAKGVGGLSGGALKAPDSATMPLCADHHRELHLSPEMWPLQWEWIATILLRAIEDGVFIPNK